MSTNPCPLCGGKVTKNEIFCRSCQEIAKKSTLENKLKPCLSSSPKKKEEVPAPIVSVIQTTNKKGKGYLFLKILVLIAILIGGGSFFSYFKSQGQQEEREYWMLCLEQNTSLSYANYLNSYPDGEYSAGAEEMIRNMKNEELISWNQLKTSNDIDAYTAYLNEYPNTPYLHDIRNKVDALAWQIASKENTEDAYQAYINNVELGSYAGNFVDEAKTNYNYLSQMVILEGKEYKQILDRVALIIEALSKNNPTKLASYLADSSVSVFDIKGLNKKAMIDSVDNIYTRLADRSKTSLQLMEGQTSILKDVNSTYFVNTFVVKRMMDKGKSKNDTLNLIVELNADSKLQSIDKVK